MFYSAHATHIVGGQISYECVGNDSFLITIKVYRDCQSNGAGFDSAPNSGTQGTITVYLGDDTTPFIDTYFLDAPVITPVDNNPDNPCIIVPPVVCVEEGVYTFYLELPPETDPYHITYQRCCRNPTIDNIIDPDTYGATYTIAITNTAQVECNNSPVFNNFPPPAICVNKDLVFDHSASDVEGDQLVYELCNPFVGGGQGGGGGANVPAPVVDAPPPYDFLPFDLGGGYSALVPLGPGSDLMIDANTGEITGFPTTQGQYVVGICVSEYRNGALLSSSFRDFQFNVIVCEDLVYAEVGGSANNGEDQIFVFNLCDEYIVDFVNDSGDINFIESYYWEFSSGGEVPLSFDQQDITVEFPGPGNFTGLMITNPGLQCTDTARIFVNISPEITTEFTAEYDTCVAGPVAFTEFADAAPSVITDYLWRFGNNEISDEQNPTYMYDNAGQYDVTLVVTDTIGCQDSIMYPLTWFPVPPLIVVDPSNVVGCPPVDVFYENLSTPVDTTYDIVWDFGDGTSGEGISPSHEYQEAGIYTIGVQITSPIGCYTEDVFTDLIEIDSQVVANFSFGPDSITNLQPSVQFNNLSRHDASWEWWIEDFQYYDQMENPTVLFPDTGQYLVQLVSTHLWGCTDTTYQVVDVRPEIKHFMPNAFSPNGDGQNEEFGPIGFFVGIENYKMAIINRWGEVVFESSDPQAKWNGRRFNSGKLSQKGVYVYRVTFTESRGKTHEYTGFVTLIK